MFPNAWTSSKPLWGLDASFDGVSINFSAPGSLKILNHDETGVGFNLTTCFKKGARHFKTGEIKEKCIRINWNLAAGTNNKLQYSLIDFNIDCTWLWD